MARKPLMLDKQITKTSIEILPCSTCKQDKPYFAFRKSAVAKSRGGRAYLCQDCDDAARKKRRDARAIDEEDKEDGKGRVMSQEDVAKELGVTERSVSRIEVRAMKKLRAHMARMGIAAEDFL
jgi:hypothetical protein